MFLHFKYATGQATEQQILHSSMQLFSAELWMLTGFVVAFSIAIAWFKDLPDTEGDSQFQFNTLALVYSPKIAFYGGLVLVLVTYICTIYWSYVGGFTFLLFCHLAAVVLFLFNAVMADLTVPKKVTRFYMGFWLFFFAEYGFFAIHALLMDNG
jgi:homogentisate phytyltransferase/homogentisate geranylgeranyltransferase